MNDLDTAAARAFEGSATVRRVERGAAVFRSWAKEARLLGAAASWVDGVRPYAGQVLVAAASTHLALAMLTRPPTWHFAIVPSIFLIAGVVLSATRTR